MKIEIDIPDDFKTFDMANRQEQMLEMLKTFGSLMNTHGQVASAEYISCLLIAAGLFTGFCTRDEKDFQPMKIEVVCPRIVGEMIKTIGEWTQQGMLQRQRKDKQLAAAAPKGTG